MKMNDDYETKSVEVAINELAMALMVNYMRSGMKIHLEPDAYYRFLSELKGKSPHANITTEEYKFTSVKVSTPAGYIEIVKDESLGSNGYAPVWSEE